MPNILSQVGGSEDGGDDLSNKIALGTIEDLQADILKVFKNDGDIQVAIDALSSDDGFKAFMTFHDTEMNTSGEVDDALAKSAGQVFDD